MSEDKTPNIYASFVAARNEIQNPSLDGANPHYKSRFATLANVLGLIREVCSRHQIGYVQKVIRADQSSWIHSFILGERGTTLELSTIPITLGTNQQAFGSELTYKRRYVACLDWGIAGEDDDDGEQTKQQKSFDAKCAGCGTQMRFPADYTTEALSSFKCPKCDSTSWEVI